MREREILRCTLPVYLRLPLRIKQRESVAIEKNDWDWLLRSCWGHGIPSGLFGPVDESELG